ncbi:MAG: sigma-70 family RNA polymerase sigma factor [Pirellulales bacterium]|nr:sigma-70 family RNA polymerase sigma factor [Pirellulales bacterium]
MSEDARSSAEPSDDFVRLYSRYQPTIFAYIAALLPNDVDADDVMSETSVVLWRKWRQLDCDDDFVRWARGVARLEVMRYRRTKARDRVTFSQSTVEMLSDTIEAEGALQETRRRALTLCKEELSQTDQQMLDLRYSGNRTARQVAQELGRPENTVYKALARIRRTLFECVRRRIAAEEHSQ